MSNLVAEKEPDPKLEFGGPDKWTLSGRTMNRVAGAAKLTGGISGTLGSGGVGAVIGADFIQAGLRQIISGDESDTVLRSGTALASEGVFDQSARNARIHGDIVETITPFALGAWQLGRMAGASASTDALGVFDAARRPRPEPVGTESAAKGGVPKTLDDLLEGATPGRTTKGRSTQFDKPGGFDQANADFDALKPTDVRALEGGGRVGTLPDGRTVIVRPSSKSGAPTLEVQQGKNRTKIRFGD